MPRYKNGPSDGCRHPSARIVIRHQRDEIIQCAMGRVALVSGTDQPTGRIEVTCDDCGYDHIYSRTRPPQWVADIIEKVRSNKR